MASRHRITVTLDEATYQFFAAWAETDDRTVPYLVAKVASSYAKEHQGELNGKSIQVNSKQPESLTELVRQNLFELMNKGNINLMRLKELSFGQKPNTKELKLISSVLGVELEVLEKLAS